MKIEQAPILEPIDGFVPSLPHGEKASHRPLAGPSRDEWEIEWMEFRLDNVGNKDDNAPAPSVEIQRFSTEACLSTLPNGRRAPTF